MYFFYIYWIFFLVSLSKQTLCCTGNDENIDIYVHHGLWGEAGRLYFISYHGWGPAKLYDKMNQKLLEINKQTQKQNHCPHRLSTSHLLRDQYCHPLLFIRFAIDFCSKVLGTLFILEAWRIHPKFLWSRSALSHKPKSYWYNMITTQFTQLFKL